MTILLRFTTPLVLMLTLGTASAQETSIQPMSPQGAYVDTAAGISLQEAIASAVAREPSLRAALSRLEGARGLRQQAGLWANPSLIVERREEPAGTDNQTMVQFSMPLELFRRSARAEVADRELDVAEQSFSEQLRQLVNEVKRRYGRAAAAARDAALTESLAMAATKDLELMRRRAEEGGASPLDRDRLAVEVSHLESARRQAIGRAAVALLELKSALGVAPTTNIRLRSTLEELTAAPLTDGPVGAGDRPDVREVSAELELSGSRLARAEAEGRFDVSVFGSYSRMNAGFPQRGFGPQGELERVQSIFHYVSGGAMVTLPLWNRNQGAVAAARAEQIGATARLEAARLSAETELAAAGVLVAQTTPACEAASSGVALARRNLDVVRQTYELGRATLPEVLAEQRRYLEAEREYTAILRDLFDARVSLEFARGDMK